MRLGLVLTIALALPAAGAHAATVSAKGLSAVIHHTEHGVPHVVADDDAGLGFGYGYAVAEDNVCLLAESYVTVGGERSKYFGPENPFVFHANNARHSNLDSDLYYRQVLESGVIERQLAADAPKGLDPRVKESMRGYVAGYNRFVEEGAVRDPACKGKPWVRPITEKLAYARTMQIASLAGGGLAITGIGRAQPPVGSSSPAPASEAERQAMLGPLGERLGLGGLGSNALALGRDASASGAGMVLGNPHLPWKGDGRLYQAHLTIPGDVDVQGATFIGVPLVVIGHTKGLAWSHTTSSAFRFTPFELKLQPGSPTTYTIDGAPKQMTSRTITVPVKKPDGSEGQVKRTLYSTEYGPVLTELLGLPLFPWTAASATAFGDANAENLRYLNHFHAVDRAQDIDGLEAALKRHQGIPWANTVAADSKGTALYADASVVPHVTDEKAASCNTALGVAAFAQLRLPVLDGSRSGCAWSNDGDAVVPGIFGPGKLPFLRRGDYVENSNDSYWLSNPAAPLEGFARIIGDERTERSLRTRLALRMVRERLAAGKIDLTGLQQILFDDRNGGGELMRDRLVGLCRSLPVLPSSKGPVAPGNACDALAGWDLRDHADSRGALLFRRFAERAFKAPLPGPNAVGGGSPQAGTWSDSFDPARPVDTPRELNVASPLVAEALGDAVNDLREASIPFDAPLGDFMYDSRAEQIAMRGGPGTVGIFNAMNVIWQPGKGYPEIAHGASYLMAADMKGDCPPVRTLMAYSQSADATSPNHVDQTKMFARGEWATERHCERDVLASPVLATGRLGCLPAGAGNGPATLGWLAAGTRKARALATTGAPDSRRRATWRWCVAGGGRLTAAFTGKGRRAALVATTSRVQSVAGARTGRRLARRGWRKLGAGFAVRKVSGGTAVVRVRRGKVRFAGFTTRANARSAKRLRALARSARLR